MSEFKAFLVEIWSGTAPLWKVFCLFHLVSSFALAVLAFGLANLIPFIAIPLYFFVLVHIAMTLKAIWISAYNVSNFSLTPLARGYVILTACAVLYGVYSLQYVEAPGEAEKRMEEQRQLEALRSRQLQERLVEQKKQRLKKAQEICAKRFDDAYIAAGHNPARFVGQRNQYIRQCVPTLLRQ
ncbi:MAG: hypothetical protein MRY32_02580 [Rickettsiales bacterium]|nr:hypothetical protein [Rickettsiales bacterium]